MCNARKARLRLNAGQWYNESRFTSARGKNP